MSCMHAPSLGAPSEGVAHGEDAEAAEGVEHREDEKEQRHQAVQIEWSNYF